MKPNASSASASAAAFPAWPVLATAVGLAALLIWQAREATRRVVPLKAEFQLLHFRTGQFFQNTGKTEEARACFERVLRNDPQAYGAHIVLAALDKDQGRRESAVEHLQQALALMPENDEANTNLGALLLEQGKIREACAHFATALATNSRHHAAMTHLAWIKSTCAEDDLRDGPLALELAARASRTLDDQDPKQLLILAAAHAENGALPEAIRLAERAVTLAQARNLPDMTATGQFHLETYRAGRPLRFTSY